MTVENIPVPGSVTTAALEERRVKALEDQATALGLQATASAKIADIQQQAGTFTLTQPVNDSSTALIRFA